MPAQRSTRQRDVISKVLEAAEGPLSVGQILQEAQQELPGIGIATVYRTVKLLTEQDRIHPVLLDGETLYERTGGGHHHHFSCTSCKKVFTLHSCPVSLPKGTIYDDGFVIQSHEITLYGHCPDCAQKTA